VRSTRFDLPGEFRPVSQGSLSYLLSVISRPYRPLMTDD